MTTLGYKLGPGAQIRVTETLGVVESFWDRRIANVDLWSQATLIGGGTQPKTTVYTVPTGQSLYVAKMGVRTVREGAATSVNFVDNYLQVAGSIIVVRAYGVGAALPLVLQDDINAPLFLAGGTVIEWLANNGDAGGQVRAMYFVHGFTFQ